MPALHASFDAAHLLAFSQHVAGARWVWLVAGLLFATLLVILVVEIYDWLRAELSRRRRVARGEPDFARPWALGKGGATRARFYHRTHAHPLTFYEHRPNEPFGERAEPTD